VEDNGGLRALATATPDVNTSKSAALERVAKSHNLRLAREARLQVLQELEVISVAVIGGEPRFTGDYTDVSSLAFHALLGILTSIDLRGLLLSKSSTDILNENSGVGSNLGHGIDVVRRNNNVELFLGTGVEDGSSKLVDLAYSILSTLGKSDTQALEASVVNLLGARNSRGNSQREKSEQKRGPHLVSEEG
jgi:hypothetical protein